MVEYNKSVVYREDWSFNMDEILDHFAPDSYMIQNDDVNGDERFDYIELSDYEQCEAVDYALYTIENDLHDLLESRVDVEYKVIAAMAGRLQEYWNDGDWTDSIKVVERIHDGHYDEEMVSYNAYLKAEYLLNEIQTSIISALDIGEELQGVAKVVDIHDEMVKMLESVMEKLKKAEYYLTFE